ncbi:MAG: hypothetical protein H8E35_08830 [Ardenticatenia bacterium]|nr:hypothetical protein [Ardenticatenia bacterium]
MRRRRRSPYSCIKALQRSREALLGLALLTIGLGILLNLVADLLGADLAMWIPSRPGRYALGGGLAVVLAGLAVALFYSSSESQWVQMEIQIPYHLPFREQPRVAQRRSYGVTTYARRAFMRRYGKDSSQLEDWLANWRRAEAEGISFQHFIAEDNAALVQCLVLYALHRYGDESLGSQALYGWWKSELPATQLAAADLPPSLGDNLFLHADQRIDEWRLWWPKGMEITLEPEDSENPFPRWRLTHRHYGHVEVRWSPHLSVAGKGSQVWQVLTQRLRLGKRSRLFIIGTRLEAQARFRWTFWPGGEDFHHWATGLLNYLEEALDWGYYLHTRTDRLVAMQDQRIGWMPEGTSLFEKLQEIEGRLERLETSEVPLGYEPLFEETEDGQGSRGATSQGSKVAGEQGGIALDLEEEPTEEGETLVI